MNARQRRKLTRKWSRLLGEQLDYHDAKLAASTARQQVHVNRSIAAPGRGRLVDCGTCGGSGVDERPGPHCGEPAWCCMGAGQVYSRGWVDEVEPVDPVDAAYNAVIGWSYPCNEIPW